MRTIRYMLFGNPHNLDDCLHYCNKSTLKQVSLELDFKEVTEDILLKYLVAKFTWTFEDTQAKYSTFYDIVFANDFKETQKEVVDLTNECLEKDLERIAAAGIAVKGDEQRFKYSVCYG